LLWQALSEFAARKGQSWFTSIKRYFHYIQRETLFDSPFLDELRAVSWVTFGGNPPRRPQFVVFEDITPPWEPDPFLQSKIPFKPRIVDDLAKQSGIESSVLDYLKANGLTSLEELKKNLIPATSPSQKLGKQEGKVSDRFENPKNPHSQNKQGKDSAGASSDDKSSSGEKRASPTNSPAKSSTDVHPPRTEFVSYVRVSSDEDAEDTEGLSHDARMDVERIAIELILTNEPGLKKTAINNPGFDLYEGDAIEKPTRFVEVKSKRGPWSGPVALSVTQFRKAQTEGQNYWLYVVENVETPAATKIHKINDPAGKAQHYTFDNGWASIAFGE
ncbi:MAG: DUF3883 domain-containing protein, partial [bacterium]